MAGNVLEFTEANFSSQVLESSQPVLVDFWAPWCGPCKALGPTIEEIANDYAGKARVGKMNTDEGVRIATQYDIQNIPTVILFKGGQPVDRTMGMVSKAKLAGMIDKTL
ncbi:MAG: thioredoxin [Planctomycetota bacterium]|nr:MAG: thioredoxin [Planctomycetota bacterium]GDY07692.1 thioredoxin [Planctomycetia bacterium]